MFKLLTCGYPARFAWKQASQTHAPFHQQGVVRLVGLEEQTGTWRRFFPVETRQIFDR